MANKVRDKQSIFSRLACGTIQNKETFEFPDFYDKDRSHEIGSCDSSEQTNENESWFPTIYDKPRSLGKRII